MDVIGKFLEGIEYPPVLSGVASSCTTVAGRVRLTSFLPLPDAETRTLRLERTRLLEQHVIRHGAPPAPDPTGPQESLQRAREKGETFDGKEFALLAVFLDGVVDLRRYLSLDDKDAPVFPDWMGRLDAVPDLRADLRRCISETGDVLDGASEDLRGAREDLRRCRGEVDGFYQRLLSQSGMSDVLRERTVTERNGRWVVPVRRDQQGFLPGIIHGLSASGSTAFMEPREAVGLNNAFSEALLREEEEVRKVLRELTMKAVASAGALAVTFDACAEVDVHQALARFATRFSCQYLMPEEGVHLFLKEARHPLLCLEAGEGYKEKVVPLDLETKEGVRVILLSGPNAGGKTVALKTMGLLCALAGAGLPVPGSSLCRIPAFRHFDTDLGDTQSLSDHLSTYEARLRALKRMLSDAGPSSLLLLDELGAGTDPEEGGAVGLACLQSFRESGAFVFATTHQPLLKLFAQKERDMMNAAMLMDEATGLPTYRFAAGYPGRSYALELAQKVGFPPELIAKAKDLLPKGEADLSEVLSKLEAERMALEKARAAAEKSRETAHKTETELAAARDRIKDEARRIRHDAQVEAEGLLKNTRRQMEHILQGVGGAAAPDREKIRQARKEVEVKLTNLHSRQGPKRTMDAVQELKVGDEVYFRPGSVNAKVLEADNERGTAVLQSGNGPRFACRYEDLGRPEANAPRRATIGRVSFTRSNADPVETVKLELDIRGYRVDEGVQAVEKHLDRALLAGLPFIRVLHGKGTGQLKAGVLEVLKSHPAVAAFRDSEYNQGGSGVTVVDLKKDED